MGTPAYAGCMFLCCLVISYQIYDGYRHSDGFFSKNSPLLAMLAMDISFALDCVMSLCGQSLLDRWPAYLLMHLYDLFLFAGFFLLLVFSERSQGNDLLDTPYGLPLLACPYLLCAVLDLTGNLFWFDRLGGYHRALWYPFSVWVLVICLLVTGIRALLKAIDWKYLNRRQEYFLLSTVCLLIVLFIWLQVLCKSQVPMMSIGLTFTMMVLYQKRTRILITRDTLTGLHNRTVMMSWLSEKMYNHKKPLYVVMMDANWFKQINDNYGHVEGDAALVQIAQVMQQNAANGFLSIRYGGDEFALVGEANREETVKEMCQAIHEGLAKANETNGKPWNITVSIGYAQQTDQDRTIPAFIDAADAELYKVKQARVKPDWVTSR